MAADVNVGVIRGLAKLTSEGIKTGKPLSPEQITNSADEFEKFMDRNGHIEDPRKLPKK